MIRLAPIALFAVTAACGPKSSATPPIGNSGGTASALAAGPAPAVTDGALWTCAIGFYDPQPCRFAREGEGWTLRKLLGSQRFRGTVTFAPDGSFAFDGEMFCPWGACDAVMQTTFRREGDGHYAGELPGGDPVRLEWNEDNAGAYGGAGYGGLTGDEQ